MPFKSDKQRAYLFAKKPEVARQIAYKNEGGPLVPTAGNANAAINAYLGGGAAGSPKINYEAGAIANEMKNKMDAVRQLEDMGATSEEIQTLTQDQVGEGHWMTDDRDERRQAQLNKYNPRSIELGSYNYTPMLKEGTVPSMIGTGLDAVGNWSVNRQNKLAAADAANTRQFLGPTGHLVTVHRGLGGGLVVSGQTGGVDPSVYVKAAQASGLRAGGMAKKTADLLGLEYTPTPSAAREGSYFKDVNNVPVAGAYEDGNKVGVHRETRNIGGQDVVRNVHYGSGDNRSDSGREGSGSGGQAQSGEWVSNDHDWSSPFNMGGRVMKEEEDVWGVDPLAQPRASELQPFQSSVQHARLPQEENELMNFGKQIAMKAATGYILPGPLGGAAKSGWLGLNAGGWVGKRAVYLNQGGMAMPQAEMQAYNEMQSLTGPEPVGAEFMMPEGSPMPEQYSPQNQFGYVPSGGKSYKEQTEADKVYIQREKAMADEDRKERAFDMQQKQKQEAHQKAMMQKDEMHAESMKQKKAGPLGPTGE